MTMNPHLLARLLKTFKIEAAEHLEVLCNSLIHLEKVSDTAVSPEVIELIYREAHSLKGASRAVGEECLESLCHSLENVFAALKSQKTAISQAQAIKPPGSQLPSQLTVPALGLFDLLHRALDHIDRLVQSAGLPTTQQDRQRNQDIIQELNSITNGNVNAPDTHVQKQTPNEHSPRKEPEVTTVRIAFNRLKSVLYQAEEMRSVQMGFQQRILEIQELEKLIASEVKKVEVFYPEVRHTFKPILDKVSTLQKSSNHDNHLFQGMLKELLSDMKKTIMLPCVSLLEAFPKLVRDLSHSLGKQAEMSILGGDIEIDRRILDEIKDPLIHIIKNSLDHGLESPEKRKLVGKLPTGTIRVTVTPKSADKVEFTIADDGAGIDVPAIKAKALQLGIITYEQNHEMPDAEVFTLLFRSGMSTASHLTEVSGRGLGLAIVQEKLEKIGATVQVESSQSTGTLFRIELPLSLANYRGILVESEGQQFVIPTTNVDRVLRVHKKSIKKVENRDTVQLENRVLSLIYLSDALELPIESKSIGDYLFLVIIKGGEQRVALCVDQICNEQDILVKKLGPQLKRVNHIYGVTVLGSGDVVPILNIFDIIKSIPLTASRKRDQESIHSRIGTRKKSILVAEDSITSRTLLKNVLESEGYTVLTAVDGLDAFYRLKTTSFDLLISDVDMPKMNGLALTSKVRYDHHLAHLPVILVTGNEDPETKARSLELGANAYIVKSGFDQNNLLDVIRKLVHA